MDKGKEKEPFLNIRGRELTLESLSGQAQFRKQADDLDCSTVVLYIYNTLEKHVPKLPKDGSRGK